ncbi:MAG: hypothetical protein ACR2O6_08490 [Ilumatobacteraceae bacterium]
MQPVAVGARRRMVSIEAAAVAGLAFAVLSFISVTLLTRLPDASDPAAIDAFYADSAERRLDFVALTLAQFAAITFLWFLAVIRRRIGDREDRFFATVFYGSGLTYIAVMLVGSAVLAGPSVAIDYGEGVPPGQDTYSLVVGIGWGIMLSVVPRVQAIFMITTSTLIMRSGAIFKGVAILGYLIAAILIVVPILTRPSGVGLPVWVALTSIVLLFRRSEIRPPAPSTPATDPAGTG